MAEIPYPVFDRPLTTPPLSEAPRVLDGRFCNRRPNLNTAIGAYNSGLQRLLTRGEVLEHRRLDGDFNNLGDISTKFNKGEALTAEENGLVTDFATLLDANTARYGRRNINFANYVDNLNVREANGEVITAQERQIRENYQAGDFHLIPGGDYRLNPDNGNTNVDRFVVPVVDGANEFAIIDGAPVEGIIRNLDREIQETLARTDLSWVRRTCLLRELRRERDVLYTSSTPMFGDDTAVTHARKEYEAKLKNENPMLGEWDRPDWYKIELSLRDRRVLNFPQGRNRWCLPLLIPLIGAIPLVASLCAQPEPAPAPVIINPPAQVIVTDICYGVEGGKLRTEIFDLTADPNPSFDGHIQREMFYQKAGLNQREFRANSDEGLVEGVVQIMTAEPIYYSAYLDSARRDSTQAGERMTGQLGDKAPFVTGTDFGADYGLLYSCTTAEQRDLVAKAVVTATTP